MEELSYTKLEELVKAKYGGPERIKRNLDRILASGSANRPVSGSASSDRCHTATQPARRLNRVDDLPACPISATTVYLSRPNPTMLTTSLRLLDPRANAQGKQQLPPRVYLLSRSTTISDEPGTSRFRPGKDKSRTRAFIVPITNVISSPL